MVEWKYHCASSCCGPNDRSEGESRLHFLEVPMKFGLNENHTVEQFLHHLVLTGVIGYGDLLSLDFCLLIHRYLSALRAPSMLQDVSESEEVRGSSGDAPMPRKI